MEEQQLLLHHLHPILVEELQLNLHIRPKLLKLSPLGIEAGQCLSLFLLIHVCLGSGGVVLEVTLVGVILHPGDLVLADRHDAVLHRLVHDRVHRGDEEIQSCQQLLPVLGQVSLRKRKYNT